MLTPEREAEIRKWADVQPFFKTGKQEARDLLDEIDDLRKTHDLACDDKHNDLATAARLRARVAALEEQNATQAEEIVRWMRTALHEATRANNAEARSREIRGEK